MKAEMINRLEGIVTALEKLQGGARMLAVAIGVENLEEAHALCREVDTSLDEVVTGVRVLLRNARRVDVEESPPTKALCVISEAYHDYDEEIFNPLGIATSIDDAKSLVERAVAAGATTCGFEIIEFKDAEAARMHGYFEHKRTDAGWLWETANLNCGELALTWTRFLERARVGATDEPNIIIETCKAMFERGPTHAVSDKPPGASDAPDVTIPLVHLNGTRGEELAEQNECAYQAMRVAIEQLIDARPNARDYYPRGEAAYPLAMAQHRMRLAALEGVQRELGEIRDGIMKQNEDRRRQRGEK